MGFVDLLLAVGAAYRVGRMLSQEDGPFDVFSNLREWAGQRSWTGRGFHCALCLSFWAALPVVWLQGRKPWVVRWLGSAGWAVVLYKLVG